MVKQELGKYERERLISLVNLLISYFENKIVYDNFYWAKHSCGCLYYRRNNSTGEPHVETAGICEILARVTATDLFNETPVRIMHKLVDRPYVERYRNYVWATTPLGRVARLLFLLKVRDVILENKMPEDIAELYNSIKWND